MLPDVIERGTVNLKFVWDVANDQKDSDGSPGGPGEKRDKGRDTGVAGKEQGQISPEEVGSALHELVSLDVFCRDHDLRLIYELWLLENRP